LDGDATLLRVRVVKRKQGRRDVATSISVTLRVSMLRAGNAILRLHDHWRVFRSNAR